MEVLRLRNMLSSSVLNYVALLASLPVLIKFHEDLQMWGDYTESLQQAGAREAFDFIIVGGGSAGSVVANRLSETHKVLVLEAGGDPSPISEIPLVADGLPGTEMTYMYRTVPQRNCCRVNPERTVTFPRGRGLGGSSNINGMMYIRGNPKDFDRWAALAGDPAWSYQNVLPLFQKSEDYHGNYELGSIHARGGELYVGKLNFEPRVKSYFMEAVAEKGYVAGDINAVRGQVFSHPETNIKNGKRHTSFPAFIRPVLNRKTLTIYRYSRAIKIHLDQNKRAVGVTYIRHGQTHYVEATKEIIVSSGVIDSPRLLLLSGIGPKADLESVGIKPEVDLPVGQNYHDHFMTRVTILLNDTVSIISERDIDAPAMFEYVKSGGGPLSSTHSRIGIGYITSPSLEDRTWPDLYTIIGGAGVEAGMAGSGSYATYYGPHVGKDACQVFMALMRPNSPRGEIRLASSNPDDQPLIDPRIFGDPSDARRMAEGIMLMVDLFESTASFRRLNAHVPPNPFPGCERVPFKTRAYWECYVQHVTFAGFHPVGTCKMGKASDPTTVVDSKLRVLGTTGLRVIDGSIMPIIMTGNPYASTVMIGELGSEFIKRDWAGKEAGHTTRAPWVSLNGLGGRQEKPRRIPSNMHRPSQGRYGTGTINRRPGPSWEASTTQSPGRRDQETPFRNYRPYSGKSV